MNSIKISSISAVLALVVMFSAATTVSADTGFFDGGYEGGFFDGGYSGGFFDGGYDSGFFDGGWDSGFYDGGYDTGFFDGGWDSGFSDGGWDSGFYDGGWDTGFYGDSYNPGYFETDSYHPGYIETDSYHPGYIETDSYHPGYIETDSYHPGYVETDSYFPGYTDTVTYTTTYDSAGRSYSIPSFGGMTIVPPTYSMPTPTYPTPRPTPTTPVTNNNCVNNSCNNTNTNINNINTNTNTNVTTVTQATPGPIVQYVAPQYPTYYPQYQYPTYYNQAPYCYITIGQGYYSSGMITLTWSSQGATSAYITPQVGQVAPNGSTSLYAYGNTVYSLTVTGPGGTYTCRTQSYAAPYAPVSPYVSLSQIPYTGITMGPIASAMYWTGMIALAIAGAYLLVYYKGGALALATSMISTGKRDAHEEATVLHEEVTHAAPVLPTTQGSAMTRDAMKIVRSEDGTPRLVISRS